MGQGAILKASPPRLLLTDSYPLDILGITMSYTVVATKVDPQTKKKAQQTADELGVPLSVVIKAFLKQ